MNLDLAVDKQGNFVLAGIFYNYGTVTTGGITLSNAGLFLIKFDRAGNVLWGIRDGLWITRNSALAFDNWENIYVLCAPASYPDASVPLAGTNIIGTLGLAKYDGAGQGIWARTLCNSPNVTPLRITVDSLGNSYSAIFCHGGTITVGNTNITTTPGSGALVKCDADGQVVWVRTVRSDDFCVAASAAVDRSGNIYVCGNFGGTAFFGTTNRTAAGPRDIFLAKYNRKGDLLWVSQSGGEGRDLSDRLAVDNDGNCFIDATFQQSATFGGITLSNVETNFFSCVVKYDPDGNAIWARQVCAAYTTADVTTDENGNCYFAVEYGANLLQGSPPTLVKGTNVLIQKYDPQGELLWSKTGPAIEVQLLRSDTLGHCYLVAAFESTNATFDGFSLSTTTPSYDAVVAKLGTTTAPRLTARPQDDSFLLSWSVLAENYYLESTTDFSLPTSWISKAVPVIVTGLVNSVTVPKTAENAFYRLKRP